MTGLGRCVQRLYHSNRSETRLEQIMRVDNVKAVWGIYNNMTHAYRSN